MRSIAVFFAFVAIQAFAMGKKPAPTPEPTPIHGQPTYSWLAKNVIGPKCLRCHSGADASAGLNLETWADLLQEVKPGNADKSMIWRVLRSDKMPPRRPMLTSGEKKLVYDWIQAGAHNN